MAAACHNDVTVKRSGVTWSNAQELPDQWNQPSNWIYVELKKSKNKHLQSQPQMVEKNARLAQ